jgi:hypothetical protein
MSDSPRSFSGPAPLVALLSWLIPGGGYFLVGQKVRGVVIGISIIMLFVLGILFAGIRVVDVPGYDDHGAAIYTRVEQSTFTDQNNKRQVREVRSTNPQPGPTGSDWEPVAPWKWIMRSHAFSEIANKPWYVGQVLTGPLCLIASNYSVEFSRPAGEPGRAMSLPRSHGRIYEIGTLYTAIAGMLNLLAIIDASYRAGQGAA